jgi:hypothetical protein
MRCGIGPPAVVYVRGVRFLFTTALFVAENPVYLPFSCHPPDRCAPCTRTSVSLFFFYSQLPYFLSSRHFWSAPLLPVPVLNPPLTFIFLHVIFACVIFIIYGSRCIHACRLPVPVCKTLVCAQYFFVCSHGMDQYGLRTFCTVFVVPRGFLFFASMMRIVLLTADVGYHSSNILFDV